MTEINVTVKTFYLAKVDQRPPLAKVDQRPPLAKVDQRPPLAKVDQRPSLAKVDQRPPLAKVDQRLSLAIYRPLVLIFFFVQRASHPRNKRNFILSDPFFVNVVHFICPTQTAERLYPVA